MPSLGYDRYLQRKAIKNSGGCCCPKGDKGDIGSPGEGTKGEEGPKGEQGPKGDQGPKGEQG